MSLERKFVPLIVNNNRQQLVLLFSLMLLIPFIWVSLLDWLPEKLITQGDYLKLGILYQREFSRLMGDWTQLLYWPGLGGGVKVHDITGSLPITQLMAYWQLDLVTAANIQVMFFQTLFAYLCTACAMRLPRLLSGNPGKQPIYLIILAGLIFAFLPILGWRFPHGHESIIIGLFTLLCFVALLLDEITGERSLLTLLICVLTLCHTLPFNSFQMIHYSVLFGAPIVLGILFAQTDRSLPERIRWTLIPVTVFLAALFISLPKLYGILANGLGDESSRAVGSNVVYSYTTATWYEWLSSLPWSAQFMPTDRPDAYNHEINYPLGPLALLLLLARPFLAGKLLAGKVLANSSLPESTAPLIRIQSGLVISLLMALVLSVNIRPFSTLMIDLVPLLESFRVPARAMLPFIVMTSIFGVAVLFDLASRPDSAPDSPRKNIKWLCMIGAPFVLAGVALNDSIINELLLILVTGLLFLYHRRLPRVVYLLVFALFAGAAIAAFKERAHVPRANPITDASIASIRDSIYKEEPALKFPLNRVQSDLAMEDTGLNSLFFLDVSSLTSYWFPLERYSRLVMALEGLPYKPAHSLFFNQSPAKGFDALNRLFNVGWMLTFEDGAFRVRPFGAPFGAAWLSDSISRYDTWEDLATALIAHRDSQELVLLASDTKAQDIGLSPSDCKITQAPVIKPSGFPYQVDLAVEGECYLTISMNYTGILLTTDQQGRILRTFPSYGSLLGIVVDGDVTSVRVEPVPTMMPGSTGFQLAGILLALALLAFVLVNPTARPAPSTGNRQTT